MIERLFIFLRGLRRRLFPTSANGKPPGGAPPENGGPSGPQPPDDSGKRVDPYFVWAEATNYAYLPGNPERGLPVLVKLSGTTASKFARGEWGKVQTPRDLTEWLTIPRIYLHPAAGLESSPYCNAVIRKDSIARLQQGALLSVIERFELGDPLGYTDAPFEAMEEFSGTKATAPVIVGMIDDGLPFANERFRVNNASTRVEYLWDQDRATDLSKNTIDNTILNLCQHAGLVDEDEAFRGAGYGFGGSGHKSWARRATHGAHVMDLACGLDPAEVKADSPRIIGVQLPSVVTADPAGGQLGPHVLAGLTYILTHADLVAKRPLPIVVNLSYGINHGLHDGTSLLEEAIDAITLLRRTKNAFTMVLAAGNSHLTRCHAHFELKPGTSQSQTLDWRVLPDDATPSFLDIRLPYDTTSKQVEVDVETPDGTMLGAIREGDPLRKWQPSTAQPLCTVWYPMGGNKISLSLLPTTTLDPKADVAPPGTWHITLKNVGTTTLKIDAWIWRDDTPMGFPIRGRQSRFDDRQYERFDAQGRLNEIDSAVSYIKRASSINGIATGCETVVIGGCRRRNRDLALVAARYSAGGPTLKPTVTKPAPRPGPDATALSEYSDASHGALAAGTRSGTVVAVNGTSVAAPQVARVISRLMAAGYNGDRADVSAEAGTNPTPEILPGRGGAGYIDPKYSTIKVDRSAPV